MILGNKPLEELNPETLISLAIVLTSIKIASENTEPSTEIKTFPLEFKFSKIAGMPISRDNIRVAEKSKAEIIHYLMSQGAIEDYRQEPLVESPLGRHIRPDFLVTIKPRVFEGFYNRAMPLALTRVETTMMYQSYPKASIQKQDYDSPTVKSAELDVTLVLKGQILSLYVNGSKRTEVKIFKNKKGDNYNACDALTHNKGRYLDKKALGAKGTSAIKDLPKTMGISGKLARYFIERDKENQKLKMADKVRLTESELEILLAEVKQNYKQ